MTSQLILGNGRGLAIASDSAKTYGSRTYEDATKIHPLKDPHRVAILQAGGVNLLGMPVSVLMNEWEETLGGARMSLEGYRDSFLSWLGHSLSKWTDEASIDNEAGSALGSELRQLREGELPVLRGGVEEVLRGGVEEVLATLPDEEDRKSVV